MSNGSWWPAVSYADINFDSKADFFSGSRSYDRLVLSPRFLQWGFPAAHFKAPPSQIADDNLLFKDGIGPNNFPIEDFVLRSVAADNARGRFGNEQMSVAAKAVGEERMNECPMPPSPPLPGAAPVKK